MNSFSLPKIFIFVFFISAVLFSLYHTNLGFSQFVDTKVLSRSSEDESLFRLEEEEETFTYTPEPSPALRIFNTFINDTREPTAYWDSWNWQTSLFQADVLSTDYENQRVNLEVALPDALGHVSNVSLSCIPENTAHYHFENTRLISTYIDVFDVIEPEMVLISQCLDQGCGSVGGICILIERETLNQ